MLTRQHAAFEFEIFKAVAVLRGFSKTHHRLAGERFLMAQAIPVMLTGRFSQIRQIGFLPIADVEQIPKYGDCIALFTWA
ncbi:hypothetical protein D3C76_1062680 [compost metagenome]